MSDKKDWQCVRCGRCCMHMHSDDTGMPCECLLIKDGVATCLIHGENKPDVCKNYPNHPDFGGEPCFFARDFARDTISKSVTEHPDVQRLIGQVETLSQEKKAIKTQYARDLVAINKFYFPKPVCKNQPPEITNGCNACLSCPMRKTCLLIFKTKA